MSLKQRNLKPYGRDHLPSRLKLPGVGIETSSESVCGDEDSP